MQGRSVYALGQRPWVRTPWSTWDIQNQHTHGSIALAPPKTLTVCFAPMPVRTCLHALAWPHHPHACMHTQVVAKLATSFDPEERPPFSLINAELAPIYDKLRAQQVGLLVRMMVCMAASGVHGGCPRLLRRRPHTDLQSPFLT